MKRLPWKAPVSAVIAATLATIVVVGWIAESRAAGGSFGLCYERLAQLAALHKAQGGTVTVVIDEPNQRKYVVILRYGSNDRELSCTRKGELLVDGEYGG